MNEEVAEKIKKMMMENNQDTSSTSIWLYGLLLIGGIVYLWRQQQKQQTETQQPLSREEMQAMREHRRKAAMARFDDPPPKDTPSKHDSTAPTKKKKPSIKSTTSTPLKLVRLKHERNKTAITKKIVEAPVKDSLGIDTLPKKCKGPKSEPKEVASSIMDAQGPQTNRDMVGNEILLEKEAPPEGKPSTKQQTPSGAKRTPKPHRPLPQIICEAFAVVTKCRITVVIIKNGTKFEPRTKQNSTRSKHLKIEMTNDNGSSTKVHKWFPIETIQEAVAWHSKAASLCRDGLSPYIVREDKNKQWNEFVDIMGQFKSCCIGRAKQLLETAIEVRKKEQPFDGDSDEETDLSLFDDDYNSTFTGVATSVAQPNINRGPIETFQRLLGTTPCAVSRSFVDEVLDTETSVFFIRNLLCGLKQTASAQTDELTQTLNALNQLLAISRKAGRAVADRLSEEVKKNADSAAISGRDLELASWFQPVFALAACIAPEAGSEKPSQLGRATSHPPPKQLFHRELYQLKDFPLCAFDKARAHRPLVGQFMRLMKLARKVGETILRKSGKTTMFAWLAMTMKAK